MPHSILVGSALATQNRIASTPSEESVSHDASSTEAQSPLRRLQLYITSTLAVKRLDDHRDRPQRHKDRENNTFAFIKGHLNHAIFDMVISLLGFAVLINSLWVLPFDR
jgi:metal iron transporter